MSSGLGSLGWGEQALMVVRFKGEITKKEADTFNRKLDQALKELSRNGSKGGGSGQVIANNAGRVTVIRSRKSKALAPLGAGEGSSRTRSA